MLTIRLREEAEREAAAQGTGQLGLALSAPQDQVTGQLRSCGRGRGQTGDGATRACFRRRPSVFCCRTIAIREEEGHARACDGAVRPSVRHGLSK